jgi:ankyrin repeat protein
MEGPPKSSLLVKTTLENAIRQNKPLGTIVSLIEQYPLISNNLHDYSLGKCSVLHLAALSGHAPLIQHLIYEKKMDVRAKCEIGGKTVLHLCLELEDQENIMKEIIPACHDIINLTNAAGRTPLHTAVIKNSPVQIVELLLQSSADINITDSNQENILHLCASLIRPALTELFLDIIETRLLIDPNEKIISPLDKDSRGFNALHCAAAVGALEICKILVMFMVIIFYSC